MEHTEKLTKRQQPVVRVQAAPPWLLLTLAILYLIVLAMLVFLPGASLVDRLRWLDSGICAQQPTHSFYPGGIQLPLCARNTGIYLGFTVTLLTLFALGRGRTQKLPRWPLIVVLALGAVAMAVDGFNSLFLDLGITHLYQPHNLLRLGTGLATGLAVASLSLPVLNQLIWRDYDEKRSIASWGMLALLLPGLILSFFAVASQNMFVLYPIALLSTMGLLIVVSSINLILIVAIQRRDETFTRYRDLFPFFSLALLFACGELLLLAQLKLSLLQALGV
ncbi:MAG TPA: DUF2085 domain-containing protein [Ktedonobacteraceae bacterium]|nr:DUF2085 domain-containing protein [Ktedonobacteraceae bacterium]